MLKKLAARLRLAQEAPGVLRRMYEESMSSNNSSSQTDEPSPLTETEMFGRFTATGCEAAEEHASSSSSSVTDFVSLGASSPSPDPMVEGPCRIEYTLAFNCYGRYEQIERSLNQRLAAYLFIQFGDMVEIKDEAGRMIVIDPAGHFGQDVIVVRGPS